MTTAGHLAFGAMREHRTANVVSFLAFIAALAWLKFGFHELWKDEWQAWMLARDMGWAQMLAFLDYEGHPALWYVYLKVTHTLTAGSSLPEDAVIQAAHLLVAAGAYFILFFRLRFSLWLRIALGAGFFLLFEYGVVNRGYALTALLAFWAVDLISREAGGKKQALATATVFFLLFQTEVQGGIIGAAWCCYLLLAGDESSLLRRVTRTLRQPAAIGWLAGLFIFVLTVYPKDIYGDITRPYNAHSGPLGDAVLAAFQGILANTFTVGLLPDTATFGYSATGLLLSALILAALHYLFWPDRQVWITFMVGMLAFWLFFGLVYVGGVRQWGTVLLFFVGCLHLLSLRGGFSDAIRAGILAVFLVAQVIYAARAVEKECRHPYSNARETGLFIAEKVPANVPVVAINPFVATPVAGYAGRKFYTLPDGEPFSYFRWLDKVYLPPEPELRLFARFKQTAGIVVIAGKPLDPKQYPGLQLWKSFDRYNIKNENYFLYTLQAGNTGK